MQREIVEDAPEEAWMMLERGGYNRLWAPSALRDGMHGMFMRFWTDVRPEDGACLVMRDGGAPMGTLSAVRVGTRSWLMQQMAFDPRRCETLLRPEISEIMHVMIRLILERGGSHVLVQAEHGKGFNRRMYQDFTDAIGNQHLAAFSHSAVFRRVASAPFPRDCPEARTFISSEWREGDEGGNIFGLMNLCRAPSDPDPAVREAGLRWASERFALIGKRHFVLLDDLRDGIPERLGFEPAPDGIYWMLHAHVAERWLTHLARLSEERRSS